MRVMCLCSLTERYTGT